MSTPTWTETESGAVIAVNGTTLISLHKEYVCAEHRLHPPPPEGLKARPIPDYSSGNTDVIVPKDRHRAFYAWLGQRWIEARDAAFLLGEPVFYCEHFEDRCEEGNEVIFWFPRWPPALMCSQCGYTAGKAVWRDPGVCDYCREPSAKYGTPLVQSGGASVAAHVFFCHVCHPEAENLVTV
jgi:hypothetical protein